MPNFLDKSFSLLGTLAEDKFRMPKKVNTNPQKNTKEAAGTKKPNPSNI